MAHPPKDDLDAVRELVETLKGFELADQQRIIRWASEKLGIAQSLAAGGAQTAQNQPDRSDVERHADTPAKYIRSFVAEKNPSSDNQLAAVVAYYYRFEASEAEKKDQITADDLQEACRLIGQARLPRPGQTLINSLHTGWLDKGSGRGTYTINTVGENLVAMTLPGGDTSKLQSKRPRKKPSTKKKVTQKTKATQKRKAASKRKAAPNKKAGTGGTKS